jgi:DNA processing protein
VNDQILYEVALSHIPGVGDILAKQLLSYCGSAEAVFKNSKGKLAKIPGIGLKTIEAIIHKKVLLEAEKEILLAQKHQVELLFYTHKKYPARLKQINDAPCLLYYKGSADLNRLKVVSIVGTRQASDYGKAMVEEIVEGLSKHNTLVVSGLAYGIDITAHRSALKNNLQTVGVMASGIDIIYPSVHKATAQQMLENGGLLTEFRMHEKPEAHNFPSRNRIIAGMADAIIIVEAAAKGGALITAEIAYSYNKDLFAVPGNVQQKFSEGCNNLIKNLKANMLSNIRDLEDVMGWDDENKPRHVSRASNYKEEDYTADEWLVISLLLSHNKEMVMDEIAWKSQFSISKIASLLLNLEFSGIIKSLPGKKYRLN